MFQSGFLFCVKSKRYFPRLRGPQSSGFQRVDWSRRFGIEVDHHSVIGNIDRSSVEYVNLFRSQKYKTGH